MSTDVVRRTTVVHITDDTQARCHRCHWEGTVGELNPDYRPNYKEPGDVIPVSVCPSCGSDEVETP
jgi:hypothetical protein